MESIWTTTDNAFTGIGGQAKLPTFLPGQVALYGRKSTKSDKSARSLSDQKDCCFELAEEYGIHVTQDCWFEEKAGHGGDEWWSGYVGSGLLGDSTGMGRTRPEFTKIMQGVISQEIRLVVCYSLDRLWRSTEIASKAIDIMRAQNCLLMDRNGSVDIQSPEGRERVLINAVNAQSQREHAAVSSGRGIKRCIMKRKLVGNCNGLGFRSAGVKSCEIRHVPEEHEVVRRIFQMYVYGDSAEEGPLSIEQIAWRLMDEEYLWTPDLHHKRSRVRTERTKNIVYDNQLRRILKDVRFIGKQRYGGKIFECDAFLYEGNTIVPLDLFMRVQEKLQQTKRTSSRSVNTYALSGRIRCGVCATAFISQRTNQVTCDPKKVQRNYWYIRKQRIGNGCPHQLPHLRKDVIDNYLDDVYAPLLLASVQESGLADEIADSERRQAQLHRELCEAERHYRDELPKYHRAKIDPDLLFRIQEDAKAEIERVRTELKQVAVRAAEIGETLPLIKDLKSLPEATRRDAIRRIIRWIAVLPSSERIETRWSDSVPPSDHIADLVILSCFGTYHSVRVYRDKLEDGSKHGNCILLRPALPFEVIGGVAEFPDPKSFYDGLQYSWERNYYDWSASEVAPGYTPGAPPKIASFEVDNVKLANCSSGDETGCPQKAA